MQEDKETAEIDDGKKTEVARAVEDTEKGCSFVYVLSVLYYTFAI